jgi:hypothetical protein
MNQGDGQPPLIDQTSPRAVFAHLVAAALAEISLRPSPMATAYLIELLDERVCQPGEPDESSALAEMLLEARLAAGPVRIRRMRGLGDRALFGAGYFGEQLVRKAVDIDYYREIGRQAYRDVAVALAASGQCGGTWPKLYLELSERFPAFVDVLAEVGERSRGDVEPDMDLLRLFERYRRTGSSRDRRRLLQLGHVPPDRGELKWWQ